MDVVAVIDGGVFEPCEVRLQVSETDTRIYACQSSLRLLPGRRLTALATSAGKKYVVKIFPQRARSTPEYEKEIAGYELLHSTSIDIPPRIYHGPAEGGIDIIVYQYISRARTLLEVFEKKPASRQQWVHLEQLAQLLARMHGSGVIHEDPHMGNFLLKGDVITVLDAGAVRRVSNTMLLEKNYGLFVAQFPRSWQVERVFFQAYMGNRTANNEHESRLHQQVVSSQIWREQHYLKKIFRECTAFHVHSSVFGKLIIDRNHISKELIQLLDNPGTMFDGEDVNMLKQGNSSSVGAVNVAGRRYVFKRYNVKNWLHRLKLIFTRSRASRSWRNAHRMILRGFPVAKPVALLECYKGGLRGVSVFVMEFVAGENSANYFLDQSIELDRKRATAQQMLDQINELHEERLIHGDLKSTNFIITDTGPVMIDLDAMRDMTNRSGLQAEIRKGMQRFEENWRNDAEIQSLFAELMAPTAKAGSNE